MILDRIAYAVSISPTHSSLPALKSQAQKQYNRVLSQELIRHHNLHCTQLHSVHLTPQTVAQSNIGLFEPYDVPIPVDVMARLDRFVTPHPWLQQPGDPWHFEATHPRAMDIVQLWAVLETPEARFSTIFVASDRDAGRLYHLAHHFSTSLPYRLARPGGSVAQYLLSNFAL